MKDNAIRHLKCQQKTCKPDSSFSWFILGACNLILLVITGYHYTFGLILPDLLEEFGSNRAATGWIGSLGLALNFLMGPLAGYFCRRFSCSTTAVIGSLISFIGLLSTSFVKHLPVMYLTYGIIFGTGSALSYSAAYNTVPKFFIKWRSVSMGILAAGAQLGTLCMSPLINVLLKNYQWVITYRIMSAIVLIIVVLGLTFRNAVVQYDDNYGNSNSAPTVNRNDDKQLMCSDANNTSFTSDKQKEIMSMTILRDAKDGICTSLNDNAHNKSASGNQRGYRSSLSNSGDTSCVGVMNAEDVFGNNLLHHGDRDESNDSIGGDACNILLGNQEEYRNSLSDCDHTACIGFINADDAYHGDRSVESVGGDAGGIISKNISDISVNEDAGSISFMNIGNTCDIKKISTNGDKLDCYLSDCGDAASISFIKTSDAYSNGSSENGDAGNKNAGVPLRRSYIVNSSSLPAGEVNCNAECSNLFPNRENLSDISASRDATRISSKKNTEENMSSSLSRTGDSTDNINLSNSISNTDLEKSSENRRTQGLDFSVWRSPGFTIFTIASTISMLGFYVPTVYLGSHCKDIGISDTKASQLYMIIAIASVCGRLLSGAVCDVLNVKPLHVAQFSFLVAGAAVALTPLAERFETLVSVTVFYGAFSGAVRVQFPLVVLDYIGLDKMSQAWGFLTFSHSMAIASGVPLAGLFSDHLGSYTRSFYLAGGIIILGAVIMTLIYCKLGHTANRKTTVLENVTKSHSTQSDLVQMETAL